MRASKLDRNRTEDAKLKITAGNSQAYPVLVTINIGKLTKFISLRKASIFIGKHHSFIAKCIKIVAYINVKNIQLM